MIKIAFCSDIHVHRHEHAADINALVQHINQITNLDAFLFVGDLSHRTEEIKSFLASITLDCPKLWVPGNHDIWVIDKESEQDSAEYRYNQHFAEISNAIGWHYLPAESFQLKQMNYVVIGTIGWFSGAGFSEWFDDDADERNEKLACEIAQNLERQIAGVAKGSRVVLVIHHVPHEQCIPEHARSRGRVNHHIQSILQRYKDKIELVIHGHYHSRYDAMDIDGVRFIAHPFGYPQQHASVDDGVKVIEL